MYSTLLFPGLDHVAALSAKGRLVKIEAEAAALALAELDRFAPQSDQRLEALRRLMNTTKQEAKATLQQLRLHAAYTISYAHLRDRLQTLGVSTTENAHFPSLNELSRARSRQLLWQIQWYAKQQGCSSVQLLSDVAGAGTTAGHSIFLWQLVNQAGRRELFPTRAPIARTKYFEGLSAEQATRVLSKEREGWIELSAGDRRTLETVSRRDPEMEAFYDAMEPQDAWNELCRITGRDGLVEIFGQFDYGVYPRSTLLYEAGTLPPTETIQGLCRAAHLLVEVPPVPGLYSRLGLAPPGGDFLPHEAAEIVRELDECGLKCDEAAQEEGVVVPVQVDTELRERAKLATVNPATRYDRLESWRFLTNYCGLDELRDDLRLPAREQLALALVRRHPDGLPSELEMRAHSALLSRHLRSRPVNIIKQALGLPLRERLHLGGAVADPWRALRMLSRTESARLLSNLYALSQSAEEDPMSLLAAALTEQGLKTASDYQPAPRMLARLYLQAGVPFAGNAAFLQQSVFSEISIEHAKDIAGMPNNAPVAVHAARRQELNSSRVGEILRRDPESERTYDDLSPNRAWLELCKVTGRFDLSNAFTAENRASAASQLDFELRTFRNDPHVAGLRRAACFADELPRVTGLRYRLGLSVDATSWPDLMLAIQQLTSAEAADIRRDLLAACGGQDDSVVVAFEALQSLTDEGVRLSEVEAETFYQALSSRAALAEQPVPAPNVPSLGAQALGSLRPRAAWAAVLQRFDLLGDKRFAIMSLDARKALAAEIVTKRPEGLHDEFEQGLAHAALLLPFIRKEYNAQQVRHEQQQQEQERNQQSRRDLDRQL